MNAPHKDSRRASPRRSGQAMIETVFVIILACLCFLGIFQYANLFAAKAVLSHAAARAARARAVGFNHWMVEKSARVASIPASGTRTTPAFAGIDPAITGALDRNSVSEVWDIALRSSTRSPGTQLELDLIPEYMNCENDPTAEGLLDYELWEALSVNIDEPLNLDGNTPGTLRVSVRQRHPLLIALAPLAEGKLRDAQGEDVALEGFYTIESHYPLYLEDLNW
ncbi:MAG: TadE/TadG family type IV pilus assembly protein [bacterium]